MAEWRIGRKWSDEELIERLAALASARTSFPETRFAEMTPEAGWRPDLRESLIGRERPGPPERDGIFERARDAVIRYDFSDPRIVEGHFDPSVPLLGRRMLLELEPLGLRFLCGVIVGDVTDERSDATSAFGFRYDTLEGHVERGSEWFLVTKDHETGEVRMRIESRWQKGDFPNWWSRVGFSVLGSTYRQLWLRRAHQRMRALMLAPRRALPTRALVHTHRMTMELPRAEEDRRSETEARMAGAALGALAGMRSTAPLVVLTAGSAGAGPIPGHAPWEERLASPSAAAIAAVMAAGEIVADKLPWIGARTSAAPMLARIAAGASTAALLARRWRCSPVGPAVAGGAAAWVSTVASYRLRAVISLRFGIPTAVLGLVEDAVVTAAGAALIRAVAQPRDAPTKPALASPERSA